MLVCDKHTRRHLQQTRQHTSACVLTCLLLVHQSRLEWLKIFRLTRLHCPDMYLLPPDMRGDIRSEWDETKQHDVLFLLTVRPPDQAELALMQQDGNEPHPAEKFGLAYVRGCEVMEVKDEGVILLPASKQTAFASRALTLVVVCRDCGNVTCCAPHS